MKKPKTSPAKLQSIKSSFACVFLAMIVGCVTVNVNFPESAVQKASDDYVRDLYHSKEQGKLNAPKLTPTPVGFLQFMMPEALADEPTFNMNSPKLTAIKNKMRASIPEILDQEKAGVLGETNEGKLVVHDESKLKPLKQKQVNDLVREANTTRESLYAEVVSSNHLASTSLPSVRKSFARSFQAESPSGTWVQGADGSWLQKR